MSGLKGPDKIEGIVVCWGDILTFYSPGPVHPITATNISYVI
jgi:hypothetical protein